MKKILMLLVVVMTTVMAAMGQKFGDQTPRQLDWWLGASVGITHSFAENATSDEFFHNYPGVEMQLGTFFNRYLGARLSMGMNPQMARPGAAQREGDPETYDKNYHFNVLTGYVDGLVDLTTLFTRKKYRPTFDLLLFAGGGVLEAFHYDWEMVQDWEYYPVDTHDKTRWGAHAGLMASYRFSPHWDLTLESSYNITPSDYDGVKGMVYLSGYMKTHAGLVYHFYERGSNKVRLSTEEHEGWTPSYTAKDREKARELQHKRLEQARKETAKRRAERTELAKKRAKQVEKAQKDAVKYKKKQAKAKAEARLYNER